MTRPAIHGDPGSAPSPPPVWVRVGALDGAALSQVREVLQSLRETSARGDSGIVVDITRLGDRHELTMFALLVDAARGATASGSAFTVVSCPGPLAANLARCDIRVVQQQTSPPKQPETFTIDLGDMSATHQPGPS